MKYWKKNKKYFNKPGGREKFSKEHDKFILSFYDNPENSAKPVKELYRVFMTIFPPSHKKITEISLYLRMRKLNLSYKKATKIKTEGNTTRNKEKRKDYCIKFWF